MKMMLIEKNHWFHLILVNVQNVFTKIRRHEKSKEDTL
jgi:hypothetical protein